MNTSDKLQPRDRPVYFICHNWNTTGTDAIIRDLFSQKKVAIHYDNFPKGKEFDPTVYPREWRTAINCIKKADKGNALVVASYLGINKIYVGAVCAGGRFLETPKRMPSNELFQLKGLQLEGVVTIARKDFPLISILQPPYSTMVPWSQAADAVNLLYDTARARGKFRKLVDFNLMSPWQLDILCEEWLRSKGYLQYKVAQPGRLIKTFHCVGIDKRSEHLFWQVTHRGTLRDFDNFCLQLTNMDHKSSAFYFDSEKTISSCSKRGPQKVGLVSFQEVFEYFKKRKPELLKRLIYG